MIFSFQVQRCMDMFGKEYTRGKIEENVEKTNYRYGGADGFRVSCFKECVANYPKKLTFLFSDEFETEPKLVFIFLLDG